MHQRWLNASLGRKGLAVVILPTVALLVSFFGFLSVEVTSRNALAGVQTSLLAQSSLQSVLTLTIDAETGIRGFIISNDSSYLAPYESAKKQLPRTFADLANQLSSDKNSLTLLSKLRSADNSDLLLLSNLLATSRNHVALSENNGLLGQEKHQTDLVRSLVESLDSRIATLVAHKEALAHDTQNAGMLIALAALILGLAGGTISTRLFTTGISERIRQLQQGAENLARGEPLPELPRADDEVGRLAEALITASLLLDEREAEILEESAFLDHLVTASPVVKFQGDSPLPGDGFVSSNLDRVFGLSADQVSRDAGIWLEAIDPMDRETVIEQAEQAIESRSTAAIMTYRVMGNDGVQRWVYSTTTLSYEGDAPVVAALGVLIDVTEAHEAEEALRQREEILRALFDASPDAIVVVDHSGRVLLASDSIRSLTGVGKSNVENSIFSNYINPERVSDLEVAIQMIRGNQIPNFIQRLQIIDVDSGFKNIEAHGVVINLMGHHDAILMVLRDVTPQVELEHRLLAATKVAEQANRAKSEFLSRMSHELRTPLNAVLGFAQILELDDLSSDQRDSLAQIRKGGQHLLQLINEVLDISRIEAGQLAISTEPVAIADVVNEVCNLLRPMSEDREIEINIVSEWTDGRMVIADRQRVRQILLNLVSNAIKYNRFAGRVNISYSISGEFVKITVEDTGPGIAKDQVELVFAPFERLGAEASDVEGTGIGLTLSRHLAEAMGGSIELQSSPAGSSFTLTLPYGGIQTVSDSLDLPRVSNSSLSLMTQVNVLYVEDNISNVQLMERALSTQDFINLIVASNGSAAIDFAQRESPDLIFLDLHLPDIGGDDVLVRLRSSMATKDIPIVVLSADATEAQIPRLKALGATDYLTKPIDIDVIFNFINSVRDHKSKTEGHNNVT